MGEIVRITREGVSVRETTPLEDASSAAEEAKRQEDIEKSKYQEDRKSAYVEEFGGTWEETLDYIYWNGMEDYVAKKSEIKTSYPKPQEAEVETTKEIRGA